MASTSTPTSGSPPTIASAWSSSVAISSPPLAQDCVRLRADGRVLVELKTAWRDGTSHLVFDSIEFMEKLAAITPRPAVNLVVYHSLKSILRDLISLPTVVRWY
jgi:hypothetical protein